MTCPVETVAICRHDNPYNGEPCEDCMSLIGDTYVGASGDPYDLPMHGHCKCFWFHNSITGIWDSDREDLQNQKNYNTQDAATTLAQINQYMAMADRLGELINQAWSTAEHYYDLAGYYYSTAEEFYEIALEFYDLAWEYYCYGWDDYGDECYYYGEIYENEAAYYENVAVEYESYGSYYESVAQDYESQYVDVVDWIEELYLEYQDYLDENLQIDLCLQQPSLDGLIGMLPGRGQLIEV